VIERVAEPSLDRPGVVALGGTTGRTAPASAGPLLKTQTRAPWDARPNWREQSARASPTGVQWHEKTGHQ
jgi:hypothetical protein